ncbi:outer membrane beta-barrel protein [Alphaproteobacteria bacterium]|nr:outer membrane beta-barrel protein [Alphaproteobacteria bacterium]MDB4147269.1 outer membrane beta-barrel protein [Alphaproteobacteria bacterium]
MNKTLLTAITIVALLPFGATAMADTHASEKTGSDMYAGISVGKAKHNAKFSSAAVQAAHDDDGGTSFSLYIGMDLNETYAIESFYTNGGKSKFSGSTTTLKGTTMGIAAKAGADLTDDFRAFVKVGYHSWKTKVSTEDDGTDVLYGVGLEYKLNETTAVVTAYDRYTMDDSNVVDMSIGIKYRF